MEGRNLHPVIRSLLNEAATELDDLALECSDASEYLEQGQMLAALGTLHGWKRRMNHVMTVIQAAQVWQEKVQHEEAPQTHK